MDIGDIVIPDTSGVHLASGDSSYDYAIVASIEPLILVSEKADMLWQTQKPGWYKVVGKADDKATLRAVRKARKHSLHSPIHCMTIWDEKKSGKIK